MTKFNNDMLNHFKNKYLGYMNLDQQNEVEITNEGFVYKGELIVSVPGLHDMIVEKVAVKVGDLKKKEAEELNLPIEKIKVSGPAVDALENRKESDDAKPFEKVEVKTEEPVKVRKKPGPKPKAKK